MKRLAPLIKLVGFVAIIALCVLAQQQFDGGSTQGYLYLGAAGVLAFLLIAPVPQADLKLQQATTLDVGQGARRWIALAILIVGLILVASGGLMFHQQLQITESFGDAPWIRFGIGLIVSLVGALLLVGIGRLPRFDITMLILIGIIVLALFVRLYQLDSYPFGVWYDEAVYGLDVRHILSDPTFRPIFADVLAFPHFLAYLIGYVVTNGSLAGMRAATGVLSVIGVPFAYLIGRELRGKWFGVMMAALLAVLRWSIDFSRIVLPGADTITFTLIAFWGVLRLVRYGRLRDAIWFGLAVGVGGYFYGQYQPQVLAVMVYVLVAYPFLRRRLTRTLTLGIVSVLAAVVVLLPIVIYAVERNQEYFNRLNQVSVFNEDFGGDTINDVLLKSTITHLEMFHLQGDSNGRHNLPGAPELDPFTGALLVLGLLIALREWRRREHLLFLLSLILALLGGILTVSFEAPQSHRAIASVVGVIYFTALGIEGMARLAVAWWSALPVLRRQTVTRGLAGVGAFGVIGVIAGWNLNIYFNVMPTNLNVWSAYSTTETLTGRFYANYSPNTNFYVSPLIGSEEVSVQYVAQDALSRSNDLVIPDIAPLRIPATNPAVMMLVPSEDLYLDYLHQLYPHANFRPIRPVDYGVNDDPNDTLFNVIELQPSDIGAIEGLSNGAGVLYAPIDDHYSFSFGAGTQLQIDNQPITSGTPVELAQGNHKIAVTPANVALVWSYSGIKQPQPIPTYDLFHDPVTPNGLLASFYANGDFQGVPASKHIDPFVYQYIQVIPMNRPYSVRYDGYLYIPTTGEYHFGLSAIDTGALDIDGKNVIQTKVLNQRIDVDLTLTQGWHSVEARHQDLTGSTNIYLQWIMPGGSDLVPINREYFCPALNLCAAPITN